MYKGEREDSITARVNIERRQRVQDDDEKP